MKQCECKTCSELEPTETVKRNPNSAESMINDYIVRFKNGGFCYIPSLPLARATCCGNNGSIIIKIED